MIGSGNTGKFEKDKEGPRRKEHCESACQRPICYREEKQSESETLQQRLLQGEIFHTDNEDVPGSILDCYLFADISR